MPNSASTLKPQCGSCLPAVHWPKQITWPNRRQGGGSVRSPHSGKQCMAKNVDYKGYRGRRIGNNLIHQGKLAV